jgi:hypothetical protein
MAQGQIALALCALVGAPLAAADMPANWANMVLDPAPFTAWTATSSDGLSKRGQVSIPFTNIAGQEDVVAYSRADLVGNAQQRGFSHGELFADDIFQFYKVTPFTHTITIIIIIIIIIIINTLTPVCFCCCLTGLSWTRLTPALG